MVLIINAARVVFFFPIFFGLYIYNYFRNTSKKILFSKKISLLSIKLEDGIFNLSCQRLAEQYQILHVLSFKY